MTADEKIKFGLLGCGMVAKYHLLPGLVKARYAEALAICSRSEEKAKAFASEFSIPKFYTDYSEMLSDKEIQAVIITTPNFLHHQQAVAAANAKKHILCEKPMALNVSECREMIESAQENDVKLMIAHHLRFKSCNRRAREIVRSGELGKVSTCRIQWSYNLGESPEIDWHAFKKYAGGGQFMNVNIHCVDLLRYILGEVKAVSAFTRKDIYEEVEDKGIIMMEFENGVLGVAEGSYSVTGASNSMELYGTRASLIVEEACTCDSSGSLLFLPEKKTCSELDRTDPYLAEIEHFAAAILENKEPESSGDDGMESVRVIQASYRSAQSRSHIDLSNIT